MDQSGAVRSSPRLWAGARVVAFIGLFITFTIAGQLVLSLLPPGAESWLGLLVALAAALAAGLICINRFDGRPLGALGFPLRAAAIRESWMGVALGCILIALATLLLLVTASVRFEAAGESLGAFAWALVWQFMFFSLAAAVEELLFRGYAFQALVDGVGPWPATFAVSVVFALAHGGNPNVDWVALANIFLAGVMLSVAYLKTQSLWFATGLHVGWNWMMASVVNFPVSGLTQFGNPLFDTVSTGSSWWTGGVFGPEAGLVGTITLCAAVVWLMRARNVRPAEYVEALRPIAQHRLQEEPWRPVEVR